MTFNASEHIIILERRSKKRDSQGHETWVTTTTEYLPVQWRLAWFRSENPAGKTDTHPLTIDLAQGAAVFEAYVERQDGGAARMHGSETAADWKDYIEKAETKALGRALAAAGYGTQFTDDEFSEGERIADAPIEHPTQQAQGTNPNAERTSNVNTDTPLDPAIVKERLNALSTQAKQLSVCKTNQEFVKYFCQLLHLSSFNTNTITSHQLAAVEQDLKERSQQAA